MISIIVINKNREKAVGKCIEAILKQKEEEDELIVIDDSSDDNSLEVIQNYLPSITSFKKIDSKGNRAFTRNYGARLANGDVFIFIDSDVIIGKDNIHKTKELHKKKDIVGVLGNVWGNDHDVSQFEFLTNTRLDDFMKQFEEDFNKVFDYPAFFDYRYEDIPFYKEGENWRLYYTSYASVSREAFNKVGGFDENFVEWGTEDIEFGYRINQLGKIAFEPNIVSIHVPHPKNTACNFIVNMKNMYYMLDKYKSADIENLIIFVEADIDKIEEKQKEMYSLMQKYANHRSSVDDYQLKDGEMKICFLETDGESARIQYQLDGEKNGLDLMGMALPIKDKTFSCIYISNRVFCLTNSLLCRIFQESLRIAQKVLIEKNTFNYCSFFKKDPFHVQRQLLSNRIYISQSIKDYEFIDKGEFYEVKLKKGSQLYFMREID